jgi:uncharacterized UBP type Zn finger protein
MDSMITNPTKQVFAKDRLYALIETGELDPNICSHMGEINNVTCSAPGCEDCSKTGEEWVNLRICLTCGHVGCCEDSPNQHAKKHYHSSGHPVIQSFNPGENWVYCYAEDVLLTS